MRSIARTLALVMMTLCGTATVSAGPVNLALGKPASATSSYSIYLPPRANDGDPNTIWNGGNYTACWQVNLQAVYPIDNVVVSSNQWGAGSLSTTFQVSSSLDNNTWTNIGLPTTGSGSQSFTFSAANAPAQYIRFCGLPGTTNWVTLGELEAYGAAAAPTAIPTLSEAGLWLLSLLLVLIGLRHQRSIRHN